MDKNFNKILKIFLNIHIIYTKYLNQVNNAIK